MYNSSTLRLITFPRESNKNFSYSVLLLELISKLVSFEFEFIQDKRKMLLNVFRNCLEVFEIVKTLYYSQITVQKLLLRHPAVDSEVEGVGGADEDVGDEDNVLGDVVIH